MELVGLWPLPFAISVIWAVVWVLLRRTPLTFFPATAAICVLAMVVGSKLPSDTSDAPISTAFDLPHLIVMNGFFGLWVLLPLGVLAAVMAGARGMAGSGAARESESASTG